MASGHNDDQNILPPYLARHIRFDSDGQNILPSPYLARHIRSDSDDVAALISAIDSSQVPASHSMSVLPHLPAEILLHILDYVPIDYILDWRRVCRGFRDAIDGRVLFDYLKRAELIGYIGPREGVMGHLTVEDHESIHLLRLSFRELQDDIRSDTRPSKHTDKHAKGSRWTSKYAIFGDREGWSQRYERYASSSMIFGTLVEDILDPLRGGVEFGTLNWCITLDGVVLDVEHKWKTSMDVDVRTASVSFLWKGLLFSFLKTRMMIRKMMEEKRKSSFTFSLLEDCLRAVRRERLRSALDQKNKDDRQIAWAMGLLRPLFGKPRYDKASAPWDGLEYAEDDAMRIIMMLQRQGSMSPNELVYLKQLAIDRVTMAQELESIDTTFSSWKRNLYGDASQQIRVIHLDMGIPVAAANPLFWDEKTTRVIGERVSRWRTQKTTIEQVMTLLRASNEVLEVPEDAFDNLGSQFE